MKYDEALWYDIFNKNEYGLVKPFLSQTDVLIDGGAYKGFFALRALKAGFSGRLILVEPVKEFLEQAIKLLKKEIAFADLKILNCALGVSSKKFYQDLDKGGHSGFDFGKSQIKFLNKKLKTILKPNVCSLNGIFDKLNLNHQKIGIKLDIEGAEFEVLQDFNKWDLLDWILIEYHLINSQFETKFEKLKSLFVKNFRQVEIIPSQYTHKIGLLFGKK